MVATATAVASVSAGGPAGPATGMAAAAPQVVTGTGHLTRYPGDQSHLQAFTQTGPVGLARATGSGPVTGDPFQTGVYPAVSPLRIHPMRPRPPVVLRGALWVTVILLIVGGAGLTVHHYRPQWLKDIGVVRTPSTPAHHAGTKPVTAAAPPVQAATIGSTTSVTVRASSYQVVLTSHARAWVQASTGTGPGDLFAGIMEPGQSQTFSPAGGKLTLQYGAAAIEVQIKVNGTVVPNWQFAPQVAPGTILFSLAPTTG